MTSGHRYGIGGLVDPCLNLCPQRRASNINQVLLPSVSLG
jgi:hypothetical protein